MVYVPMCVSIGAEPAVADDAARSLVSGVLQPPLPPTTIVDGLLTALSERTFAVIREHVEEIVTVGEDAIAEAMVVVWERGEAGDRTFGCRRGRGCTHSRRRRHASRHHPLGRQPRSRTAVRRFRRA